MRLYIFLLTASAACAWAGEARIGPPRLGYVLSGSGELQSVEGVAGAAWINDGAPREFKFQTAAVSPRQDYALGISPAGELILAGLSAPNDAAALLPAARNVALSPTGAAATAYSQVDHAIVVWTGLPRDPSARRIALTGIVGDLDALAVSDDGRRVLGAFRAGETGALYRFQDDQIQLITELKSPVFAFLPGSHAAVVAVPSSGHVFSLRASLELLTTRETGVVAVAASANGQRAFLATSHGVRVIGMDGTGEFDLQCDCSPAALERLNDANLFRLTDAARGTLWLFDGQAGKERVFFVPREVR